MYIPLNNKTEILTGTFIIATYKMTGNETTEAINAYLVLAKNEIRGEYQKMQDKYIPLIKTEDNSKLIKSVEDCYQYSSSLIDKIEKYSKNLAVPKMKLAEYQNL